MSNYRVCDKECKFWHYMVDVMNPNYEVEFCDFTMEAIANGTRCVYYTKRGDEEDI